MPRVVFLQRVLTHYRVPFFEHLREILAGRSIDVRLIVGQPEPDEARKADTRVVEWATQVKNRYVRVCGRYLVWQPVLGRVRGVDLVVVEQASRLLVNYPLSLGQTLGGPRVALWGHGLTAQGHRSTRFGERLKRWMSARPHWWFAYNDLSADWIRRSGFPETRITSVNNAVDTQEMRRAAARLTDAELDRVRRDIGVRSGNVGVFIGGLYAEKRIPFLMEAADGIRALVPDFELVVMGGGPDQEIVESAAGGRPWVHWTGPVFDHQKVVIAKLGKVLLMPGLVGLAVLDSFALGLPMVTTAVPYHSPEVAYLESGRNGVIVADWEEPSGFVAAVVELLRNEARRKTLVEGCLVDVDRYTVEEMALRFADGISAALATPRRH